MGQLVRELIVDSFAGGGGASTGIFAALGIHPDIAINHDAIALAMHQANHRETRHIPSNIWKVDPVEVTRGLPVGLLWASPDCKHFSKAKGGKPVEKNIRDLAWVVAHWADKVRPRVILLENVEEFTTWGPLGEDHKPCPLRKGETFKRWLKHFQKLGYRVEWRELVAANYGGAVLDAAPTIRKRLYVIMRCDGEPIEWPAQTHFNPKAKGMDVEAMLMLGLKPWRAAAEIIDWTIPCPSIFDTAEEIMEKFGIRAIRPLKPNTLNRLGAGLDRFVINNEDPFIVPLSWIASLTHQNMSAGGERNEPLDEPMNTVTGANRGEKALVMPQLTAPFIAGVGGRMGQSEARGGDQPMQTLTAKADSVVVTPVLVRTAHGEMDRNGKKRGKSSHDVKDALGSVLASQDFAIAAPFLTKFRKGNSGADIGGPLPTVTANSFIKREGGCAPLGVVTPFLSAAQHGGSNSGADGPTRTIAASRKDQHQIIAPYLAPRYLEKDGQRPRVATVVDPLGVVTPRGNIGQVVVPHLMTMRNAGKPFSDGREPAHTITAGGAHLHLVNAFLAQHNIGRNGVGNPGRSALDPASTILGSGSHQALVAAHIMRQFGTATGHSLHEPARAVMADGGGGKAQLVYAFMQKYYGNEKDGQDIKAPLGAATTKDRFGLVIVNICGVDFVVNDIGMRMLVPRELFRAQGFPETYIIEYGIAVGPDPKGRWKHGDRIRLTKTQQVRMCGNSVCPPMAEAIVRANFTPRMVEARPKYSSEFYLEAAE
jgi:DNA (cytosine-5)-methyltransferase 1